ncbi:putative Polyprenyl synthetase [Trypanosoma vivax]|uniref:Farnesyl pyrophosphate synthase n=1 Tax=Trypanosoma vivax (strain Y486) TaxID=1055687 RepID=G0TYE1_TRYVY|nr:farnesyl pyrophosphate synthase [Trypanosoma vivax]KAH8619672.1 putative Polyprenyl synthetase [Trypanosoma vivax]CCC48988.1 farnesyl pyrophosphate synthase [Trypanosoma vivax Y486]
MEMFMRVYAEIQEFLLGNLVQEFEMDTHRLEYLRKMMDTTCLGGKCNRGLTVVSVVRSMLGIGEEMPVDQSAHFQTLHDACVCGWMIEFLQAHYLVEDDIMDGSLTRRGMPCWYRRPGVTMQNAINDGLILKSWANMMAAHYFGDRPFLKDLLRFFNKVDYTTAIGQLYDVTSMCDSGKLDPDVAPSTKRDYSEFTLANYKRIVKHKTAFYTYYLPLVMGLVVSGTTSKVDMNLTEQLAMLMGEYFQVQDDVMDCYTPPDQLGKIGTDIEEAKCSWLAVMFLSLADGPRITEFKANYGCAEQEKVATVKRLYKEMQLEARYFEYEADVASRVIELIGRLREGSPEFANSVEDLWSKTYRRQK